MDTDTIKDIIIVLLRIVTIMPLTLFLVLYMGKRSIGELPVFDFLVIIVLGSVVGADIADPDISHIHTVVAIIAIALLQKRVSKWIIQNRKVGKALTFEPTVVMQDGVILEQNMIKIQYSIEDVLQMLREKDVFDIDDVKIAIIEANGNLTVQTKDNNSTFFHPVVVDGKLDNQIIISLGTSKDWFLNEMLKLGINNLEEVFYAGVSKEMKIRVSLKNNKQRQVPNVNH